VATRWAVKARVAAAAVMTGRVAARYILSRGALGPVVQGLSTGKFNVALVEQALAELDVIRNGDRWSVDADWYSALGPRHQKRALTIIRALGRLVLEPDAAPQELFGQLAFEIKWLQGIINKADDKTFQHGVFEIVPHGVTGPKVRECLEALDKAYKILQPKFPKVLYGRVFIVKNLSNHMAAARYNVTNDVVYLSLKARGNIGDVHALCHEFGHRYFYKFWKNKDQRDEFMRLSTTPEHREITYDAGARENVAAEYIDIAKARRDGKPQPKPSELFLEWMGHTIGTPAGSVAQKLGVRFVKGEDVEAELRKAVVSGKDFTIKTKEVVREPEYVTSYGKTGGWMENFAEAFAHYVMGKNLPPGIGAIMESLL
jgi:hypothetical protein